MTVRLVIDLFFFLFLQKNTLVLIEPKRVTGSDQYAGECTFNLLINLYTFEQKLRINFYYPLGCIITCVY